MRTVIVTGASRGLGREFVLQLRDRGDRVLAACRKPDPEDADARTLDVADPASIDAFARALDVPAVDLIVHNAGIPNAGWAASERLGTLELEAMETVMRTNCLGPLLLTQALLPRLEAADRPLVAGISSYFSSLGGRNAFFANNFAYSMSKTSLNMWLRSVHFLREGIRTVALDPGWVRTDMGGPEAPLEPREVVAGCLRVLDGLTTEQSGSYLAWDGQPVPW